MLKDIEAYDNPALPVLDEPEPLELCTVCGCAVCPYATCADGRPLAPGPKMTKPGSAGVRRVVGCPAFYPMWRVPVAFALRMGACLGAIGMLQSLFCWWVVLPFAALATGCAMAAKAIDLRAESEKQRLGWWGDEKRTPKL